MLDHEANEMPYTIDLTAWYLNSDRILQLLNRKDLQQVQFILSGFKGPSGAMTNEGIARSILKKTLEEWLQNNKIPTLGELFTKSHHPKSGQLFTILHDFYGKGLKKINSPSKEIPRDATAEIYAKLKFSDDYKLRIFYHPDNLISQTSWSRLGGRSRFFCFAYIENVTSNEIHARPYVIGDLNNNFLAQTPEKWNASNYGEIHPAQIDQFNLLQEQFKKERKAPDITLLKEIPESKIKMSIAEILHESTVPNDWGGEKSDLFSTNVSVDGQWLSTAFLFKGPAKFSPMKMIHLGKNGDQIERLFSEPANLLVLQHCHEITNPVRATMRAYAARIHDLRYFSIIDGYDTVRILKSYDKL